jgi:hypothetical protein
LRFFDVVSSTVVLECDRRYNACVMISKIPRFLIVFIFYSFPVHSVSVCIVLLTTNVRWIFRTCFILVDNTRYGL